MFSVFSVCVNSEFGGLGSDERRSGTFWRATVRIVVGVRVIKAVSVGGGGGGEAAAVVQVLIGFAPIGCRRGGFVCKGRDQRGNWNS